MLRMTAECHRASAAATVRSLFTFAVLACHLLSLLDISAILPLLSLGAPQKASARWPWIGLKRWPVQSPYQILGLSLILTSTDVPGYRL